MTAQDFSIPDVIGEPPNLAGSTCVALICQQFLHRGKLHCPANVVYIEASGTWHRLFLDSGAIHWRPQSEPPQPFEAPEDGWTYPLFDLGQSTGLTGLEIIGYKMQASESGCSVTFHFADGRQLIFQEISDVVSYAVI